jgi:adenylosuccinate lyase
VIENLVVYPENMLRTINSMGGLHNSQRVLLALVEKGFSREDAYRLVQRNAMRTWKKEGDLDELLKQDTEISAKLKPSEIDALFDLDYHFKHVDTIFARVFGKA